MAAVRVAATHDIPEGTGQTFEVHGQKVAVFNVGGRFYALDDTCSHEEASLGEGELDSDELCVECPRHGALFDLETGQPRTLPAFEPVTVYSVRVEENGVVVEVP